MTDKDAGEVTDHIRRIDLFGGVTVADYDHAIAQGMIVPISGQLVEQFLDRVAEQQVNPGICGQVPLRVVYTRSTGPETSPCGRSAAHRCFQGDGGARTGNTLDHPPPPPLSQSEIRQAFEFALRLAKRKIPTCCWPPTRTVTGSASLIRRDGNMC